MITLAVAYSIVWAAVAFYLLYMGAAQRRLQQNLESLEHRMNHSREGADS